jgi:U5 small nuclear ribonucleoprotein component
LNAGAGDPTDTSIKLRPLEPASGQALARDLVLKTRRRKGLGEQIAVSKYLDDEFVVRICCLSTLAFVLTFPFSWRCLRQVMQTFLDRMLYGE